jgi:hypothetical protein
MTIREVRKSIYNVSRPNHFGSIKKMPIPPSELTPEDTPEAAYREFMKKVQTKDSDFLENVLKPFFEEAIDPKIQEQNTKGKKYLGPFKWDGFEFDYQLQNGSEHLIRLKSMDDLEDILDFAYGTIGYDVLRNHIEGQEVLILTW